MILYEVSENGIDITELDKELLLKLIMLYN